jgi:cyclopropane-fatty-acyl-phospholipid synthase
MQPLLRAARRIQVGELVLVAPQGSAFTFRGDAGGPTATLQLRSPRTALRLLLGGDVGMAEGYIAGEWDSPDLDQLLTLGVLNDKHLQVLRGTRLMRLLRRARHRSRSNSPRGSQRNIRAHYDQGNEFFSHWLDRSMTYSCGLFDGNDHSLEQAQRNKYSRVLQLLRPAPGSHILEIGCGWGGFAETAARLGHHVTGVTLSPAQQRFTQERLYGAGLADRAKVRLQDYRDIRGKFDHVVCIEMFEAVGERFWPAFFRTLRERLRPGGRGVLQLITLADDVFPSYRKEPDFIQLQVFPGGMLPSASAFGEHARRAGFEELSRHFHGEDYIKTLGHWYRRLHAVSEQLLELGFERRLLRLWSYYLAYCRAGFRTGRLNLMQTVLAPGQG